MSSIIPQEVDDIVSKLEGADYKAYLVGGCIRDFLLHKPIKDFDITTEATPEQIKEVFPEAITAGNTFLVSLVNGIEVATFRKDFDDHAERSLTLKEDVLRRDFTINALAGNIRLFKNNRNYEVIDYVGGVKDLENRVLRFVGEPQRRIEEDPVRILRGIRFASKYNLEIEKHTYRAMCANKDLIESIPKERIVTEIKKAFDSKCGYRFVRLLQELDMLKFIFPCLYDLTGIGGGGYHNETVLDHCLFALKAVEDMNIPFKLKLACLYHDVGKCQPIVNDKGFNTFRHHDEIGPNYALQDLKYHLKMPNDIVEYVVVMCRHHMHCIDTARSVRKLMVKLEANNIPLKDFIIIRYADNNGNLKSNYTFKDARKAYRQCLEFLKDKPTPFSVKSLEINGKDVMRLLNIQQGKQIGIILNSLFNKVVDGELDNKRDVLESEVLKWNVK